MTLNDGCCFLGKANVVLEPNVKLTTAKVDALGENFDKPSGYLRNLSPPTQAEREFQIKSRQGIIPVLTSLTLDSHMHHRCRFSACSPGNRGSAGRARQWLHHKPGIHSGKRQSGSHDR